MTIRRWAGRAVLAASLLANAAAAYVLGTFAANHGRWQYVRERLHLGGHVSVAKVEPDADIRTQYRMAPKVPGQFLFLGNSLTYNVPWAWSFPSLPIENRAMGGSTLRDAINMVRTDHILSGQPAKVFLQFGTNEFGTGSSVDGFLADYAELLDLVRADAPAARVYVQGLIPARFVAGDTADPALYRESEDRLRGLAAARGYTFVPLYAHFALDPSKALPADLTTDDIHLTLKGELLWIDVLRPYILEGTPPATRNAAAGAVTGPEPR